MSITTITSEDRDSLREQAEGNESQPSVLTEGGEVPEAAPSEASVLWMDDADTTTIATVVDQPEQGETTTELIIESKITVDEQGSEVQEHGAGDQQETAKLKVLSDESDVSSKQQTDTEIDEQSESQKHSKEDGDKSSQQDNLVLQDVINPSFVLLEDDEDIVPEEELTKYIFVEETVMDDLGKEVKVKQKVPILRETHRFERVTITEGDEGRTHKFIETITRVIKKSEVNEEGELEEKESEVTEMIEHEKRPEEAETVYAKRINEKGEIEEVVVPIEEIVVEVAEEREPKERSEARKKSTAQEKVFVKKKVLKMVKEQQIEPCTPGKVLEVIKPIITEIDVEEDESDIEEYLIEEKEGLTEEEQAELHDRILRKREARVAKLKDNLRTVLVRLALAEKKKNLYMQLISISSEVKEDILNPPDPDKPSFRVPKKVKSEDKFRRLYSEKLMEYRELRSAILVKLAMEKKRKEEVKSKYDVIASDVARLRKTLEDKLMGSLNKLLPKNDPVFKNQSPLAMVRRFLELLERLDNETKELMYKKKQMYLAKQKYDEVTENEQGLSYKFSLANKELKDLVSKNDRRNEKLESLKTTMQKECLAITHINQKCDAILKTTDEKNSRFAALNYNLNRARQDRKDVHQARRKVETELKQENARIKLKNHPSLLKEYQLVDELLKAKQDEFDHLKKECLSSLEQIKKATGTEMSLSHLQ